MEPDLKLYIIKDLREWLIHNNPLSGLNEHVIAPTRAYAILNNPYVKDDDAVVAAIYEGDELAAYTACFADMLDGKRIWWASTLWCNPKFQGKGYGLIVIGSLMEAHDGEVTLDRWGAKETVEIFKCLGYETIYTSRYHFGDKAINRGTLKGKLSYCVQELKKTLHATRSTLNAKHYTLKYSTFIDGEAYAFMQEHRGNDLFLREQSMLNWILRYPFMQGCLVRNRVERDTMFTANVSSYGYWSVKVYQDDALIGVYVLRRNGDRLSVIYMYYEEGKKEIIFASIVEHVSKLKIHVFTTENKDLADFVQQRIYFPRKSEEQVSFSYPSNINVAPNGETTEGALALQLGDGDSFA